MHKIQWEELDNEVKTLVKLATIAKNINTKLEIISTLTSSEST